MKKRKVNSGKFKKGKITHQSPEGQHLLDLDVKRGISAELRKAFEMAARSSPRQKIEKLPNSREYLHKVEEVVSGRVLHTNNTAAKNLRGRRERKLAEKFKEHMESDLGKIQNLDPIEQSNELIKIAKDLLADPMNFSLEQSRISEPRSKADSHARPVLIGGRPTSNPSLNASAKTSTNAADARQGAFRESNKRERGSIDYQPNEESCVLEIIDSSGKHRLNQQLKAEHHDDMRDSKATSVKSKSQSNPTTDISGLPTAQQGIKNFKAREAQKKFSNIQGSTGQALRDEDTNTLSLQTQKADDPSQESVAIKKKKKSNQSRGSHPNYQRDNADTTHENNINIGTNQEDGFLDSISQVESQRCSDSGRQRQQVPWLNLASLREDSRTNSRFNSRKESPKNPDYNNDGGDFWKALHQDQPVRGRANTFGIGAIGKISEVFNTNSSDALSPFSQQKVDNDQEDSPIFHAKSQADIEFSNLSQSSSDDSSDSSSESEQSPNNETNESHQDDNKMGRDDNNPSQNTDNDWNLFFNAQLTKPGNDSKGIDKAQPHEVSKSLFAKEISIKTKESDKMERGHKVSEQDTPDFLKISPTKVRDAQISKFQEAERDDKSEALKDNEDNSEIGRKKMKNDLTSKKINFEKDNVDNIKRPDLTPKENLEISSLEKSAPQKEKNESKEGAGLQMQRKMQENQSLEQTPKKISSTVDSLAHQTANPESRQSKKKAKKRDKRRKALT